MSGELMPAGRGAVQPSSGPAIQPSPGAWTPPPSRPTPDDDIDLREAWGILRRNWWIVAGSTLLGLLAAFAYVKLATPIYRSSTTLQFQEKGSTVPVLDALRDLQGGTEVGTEMEVLRSRSLAEAVIDSLGLQVQLGGPRDARRGAVLASVQADADAPASRFRLERGANGRFTAELLETEGGAGLEARLGTAAPGEPLRLRGATVVLAPGTMEFERIDLVVLPRTMAAERFGEALGVSRPNRDANVVRVWFDAPDPELARDVANVLAHQYLVRRNVARKVSDRSTVDFLRSQVDTLQVQLRSAEDAVRRFREANRVVSLEAEAQAQVERLAALQAQRAELEAEREALAGLLAEARAGDGAGVGASPYRRLLAFPTLLRNQTTSTLLEALTARETELSQLRARRTPADPDYRAVAGQLQGLEDQATAVVTTYLGGLENQVEAIDRELAGFGDRMAAVPAKEVEYARLERSARVLADIYTLLQTRLKEAEVVEAVEDASVRVVDPAVIGPHPVRPRAAVLVPLLGLLGATVGGMVSIGRSRLDRAVRTREDVEAAVGIPTVAVIPRLPRRRGRAASGSRDPAGGMLAEAFGTLRTNLLFLNPEQRPHILSVTSALPAEGKSFTTLRLAQSLARQGLRVAVLDADLRRGRLHEPFEVPASPGLSEALAGLVAPETTIKTAVNDEFAGIRLIPRGQVPPNPAELHGEGRLRKMAELALIDADLVLVDSPPLLPVTDSALIGAQMDGVLVVVRAGATDTAALREAVVRLRAVRAPVLGVVLNAADPGDLRYYGGYEGYTASPVARLRGWEDRN
jgi:tyrosine-protein kinase Etk/Wzc